MVRQQFTAIDASCRWTVADVRSVANAATAREFLDDLIDRMPFPTRAIQVDGGSEFMAQFEAACQNRAIQLFQLLPRSLKLNGTVERANRTYRNEFYECYDGDLDLPTLQAALRAFEHQYNHQRPHQTLGYATPYAYLQARRL